MTANTQSIILFLRFQAEIDRKICYHFMLNNAFSKHSSVWEHCPLPFQEDLGPLCVASRAVFARAAEEGELQGP